MKILALIVLLFASPSLTRAQQEAPLPRLIGSHPEKFALKYPTPPYPKKARANHITGSGLFQVDIDSPSGQVIDVIVITSTGSELLDQSAIETLRRWEFRPNLFVRLQIPIAFTFDKKKR